MAMDGPPSTLAGVGSCHSYGAEFVRKYVFIVAQSPCKYGCDLCDYHYILTVLLGHRPSRLVALRQVLSLSLGARFSADFSRSFLMRYFHPDRVEAFENRGHLAATQIAI